MRDMPCHYALGEDAAAEGKSLSEATAHCINKDAREAVTAGWRFVCEQKGKAGA